MGKKLISIRSIGVDYRDPEGFTIDRPRGSGDVVFIQFESLVDVDLSGTMVGCVPGDCILYTPPFPQWYRGGKGGFANHWFHAYTDPMAKAVRQYDLPVNRPFKLNESGWVRSLLEEIERERARREPRWEEAIDMLVRRLLLYLSRHLIDNESAVLTPHKSELLPRFRDMRQDMYSEPGHDWRVPDMAERAHLSESRFAVLYKEFFGVPPREDLIRMRIERAKSLLTNTALPVGDVASLCGFENIYHFSRLFRRRVGCPPSEYYRHRIAKS